MLYTFVNLYTSDTIESVMFIGHFGHVEHNCNLEALVTFKTYTLDTGCGLVICYESFKASLHLIAVVNAQSL